MADDDNVTDPQENPVDTGHLPGAGEVGNGPVSYHDPVTQPTDDSTTTDTQVPDDVDTPPDRRTDNIGQLGNERSNPQPGPEQTGGDPTPGSGGTAGLS